MADDLISLYKEMAELTLPKCKTCRIPLSCCSPEYCEMAIEYAKEKFNIELQRTEHKTLPLMGSGGCTAAPHLRPLCTMHVCSINSFGFDLKDKKWTNEYFDLREKIFKLESE